MKTTIIQCMILLSLTPLWSCNQQNVDTIQPASLDNLAGSWVLSKPQTGFTVTLDIAVESKEGAATRFRFTGLSPINQYGSDATVQPSGDLTMSSIISTKRGGSTEEMNTETAYYRSLQRVTKASIVGGKLQLKSAPDAQLSAWETLVYDKQ